MREIKFRMWDEETNKYYTNPEQAMECLKQQAMGMFDHVSNGSVFEQYTGLKDKNGVEIYEGDIVHCWGGESCQGYHEYDTDITVDDEYQLRCFEIREFDEYYITGNIHDKAPEGQEE